MDILGLILALFELSSRMDQRLSGYKELRKLLSTHVCSAYTTLLSEDVGDFVCCQTMNHIILARKRRLNSKYNEIHDLIESLNRKSKFYLFCRCKSKLSKLKLKLSDFNDSVHHLEILYAISSLGYEAYALLAITQENHWYHKRKA